MCHFSADTTKSYLFLLDSMEEYLVHGTRYRDEKDVYFKASSTTGIKFEHNKKMFDQNVLVLTSPTELIYQSAVEDDSAIDCIQDLDYCHGGMTMTGWLYQHGDEDDMRYIGSAGIADEGKGFDIKYESRLVGLPVQSRGPPPHN